MSLPTRWIRRTIFLSIMIVVLIGVTNYIVDPFHQYRAKSFYSIAYISKLERYINPGIAKNYDYDTVILGSSTSENFVISDVKKILDCNKPIKLTISGTSVFEESLLLKVALKHKKIKTVIYGLDPFLYWGNPNRTRHSKKTFPFYLYDDNIFNDYKYIFSLDTFIKSLKILLHTILGREQGIVYDFNRMYQWQHHIPKTHFSTKYVLQQWLKRKKHPPHLKYEKFLFYKQSFESNFLKLIEQYPKVHFIIYFPPYSILAYKYDQELGILDEKLQFKYYLVNTLSKYKNVKIYDFQIAKEITHNLSNYHDLEHFHQKINKWILQQIRVNNYRVTMKNVKSFIRKIQKQIQQYQLREINK